MSGCAGSCSRRRSPSRSSSWSRSAVPPRPAPASDALHELDDAERALLEAEEERDRALAALKELEADHRAAGSPTRTTAAVVGPLRREAAEALRTLDRLEAGTARRGAKSG